MFAPAVIDECMRRATTQGWSVLQLQPQQNAFGEAQFATYELTGTRYVAQAPWGRHRHRADGREWGPQLCRFSVTAHFHPSDADANLPALFQMLNAQFHHTLLQSN